ncbi:MAG: hypothetical protein EOM24_23660, partial [Chloroflexia bacterium]|nr:hypothetical protein [Chloroflexia bacterium]
MKILFVTDPHLGLSRKANFTAESSARREDWSRRLLGDILDAPVDHRICPGDFFDRHSNSETTILDVRHLAQRFDLILAGNHDLSNRTGTRSSLDVIGAITKNVAKEPMTLIFSNAAVHVVPHCMTQALFEHALEQLQPEPGWYNLLILHCNYGVEFALDESALNLSSDLARQ